LTELVARKSKGGKRLQKVGAEAIEAADILQRREGPEKKRNVIIVKIFGWRKERAAEESQKSSETEAEGGSGENNKKESNKT